MLERIPTVLTAQEALDKAFQKAMKIDIPDPVRYHRIRKTEAARMGCVVDILSDTLARYPKAFPNLDGLRDYNQEVLDIMVGLPKLRKALGSVRWAAEKIADIGRKSQQDMRRERTVEGIKKVQNRCYGRISSLAYEVDRDLSLLRETRDSIRILPTVNPGYPTLVIAGFPNVGKSSLLRAWTGSRAEVDAYAFTTKAAEVGHFDVTGPHGQPTKIQVVDTPGLLDRPDEERNTVERQAVAALRHTADAVLFLIDPTETSGYGVAQQEKLLAQVEEEMSGVPILVAETKADLWTTDTDRVKFSTHDGQGLDGLKEAVLKLLPLESEPDLEEDPLDAWRRGERQ